MSIRDHTPISFLSAAEVDIFLAISTLLPSPLTSYSSPLPQIPSPPLSVSSPLPISPPPLPASPTHTIGIELAFDPVESRKTPSRSETPPSGTPPLNLYHYLHHHYLCFYPLLTIERMFPRLRYCLRRGCALLPVPDMRSGRAHMLLLEALEQIMEDPDEIAEEIPVTDVVELGQRMTDFVTTVRQDTYEIYGRLDYAYDDRLLMSNQLNLLRRRAHDYTTRLMEGEARASREAWVQSMDASDTTRSKMAALQSQQTPARDPTHLDVPEEAGKREATEAEMAKIVMIQEWVEGDNSSYSMFLEESDKIAKYVGGLPDMIHRSVKTSKPKTMQDAIEFTTELMDKKINTFVERQADNKRKFDGTSKNNQNKQQQRNKRQRTGRAYTAGPGEKKPYGGSKPLCSKCNYHHDGPCAPKCHKCNRVGHLARDCRNTSNANTANNQKGTGAGQKATCFE
ncbi:putative reverse transcriptase domain-containing protein [Tanacetum coccineum]